MIVNIIGAGQGFEEGLTAPGEKWLINYWRPEADILFEVHADTHPYHEKLRGERENAVAAGCLVIGNDQCQCISNFFGIDYFGSSTDWAIAVAILRNRATEIHLWGVSMDDKGDHYEKRCATDFWCGMAMGMGIKVVVHGNSTVMTTTDGKVYGLFTPMKRRYEHVVAS